MIIIEAYINIKECVCYTSSIATNFKQMKRTTSAILFLTLIPFIISCKKSNSTSPSISVPLLSSSDTIHSKQCAQLQIESIFQSNDSELKSFYFAINDSIFESIAISGTQHRHTLDTSFTNAGIYAYSLYVTDAKNLTSEEHMLIQADSVLRPLLKIYTIDTTAFPLDSIVSENSHITFIIAIKKTENSLKRIAVSNADTITLFSKEAEVGDGDTIVWEQIISKHDTILKFTATDSAGFDKAVWHQFSFN